MAPELTSESVPEVTSHRSDHERSEDQSARLGMCKMRQRVTNSDLPSGGWWESSDLWSCRQCWGQSAPTGGGDWGRPQQISLRPLRCPPRIVPVGVRQVGDSTDVRPWWVSGPRMGLASRCVAGRLYSLKVPPHVNLHCCRCYFTGRRWVPRYCCRVLWGGGAAPALGSVSPCIPTSARPGLLHPVAGLALEKVSTRQNARLSPASSGRGGA